MLALRWRWWWLAGGLSLAAIVVVGSLLPGPMVDFVSMWDKARHAIAYAALTCWFCGLWPVVRYRWIALAVFLLGCAVEALQAAATATRSGDLLDIVANSTGVIAGWVLSRWVTGTWALRVEGWLGVGAASR